MKFIIFLISNIVISYHIERKSKIANVAFSVLFTFFLFCSLFISDLTIITDAAIKIFGYKTFSLFNDVFYEKFEIIGLNYSVIGLTQTLLALSILVSVILLTAKVFSYKLCIKMKKIIVLIPEYIGIIYEYILVYFKKIYLRFERFRL